MSGVEVNTVGDYFTSLEYGQVLIEFNKDGDYNHSSSYKRCTDDGHKYTLSEVEGYAEKFIDEIIKCENDFHRELENNVYEKRIKI